MAFLGVHEFRNSWSGYSVDEGACATTLQYALETPLGI